MKLPQVRLYNTFSRTKEDLHPLQEGTVRLYSCGPTVYRYVHVGNLRTFMLPDLLRRGLEYLGYKTEQVMNITDVGHLTDDSFDRGEDKMLVAARLESKSTEEVAAHYTDAFLEDIHKLNIRPAEHYPRATQYVPRMLELIEKLIEAGHAYEIDGTVYYDIATFPAYGKLSGNSVEKLMAGHRGEPDPLKLATSPSGGRQARNAFRHGRARGAGDIPAGTSSARRCRCRSSASASTSTRAEPTTCFRITRPRSRSPRR